MTRLVTCSVYKEELEGLDFPPYPGDIGQKILDNVSKKAWQDWLSHQTMLINENRLSPINREHRTYLEGEMHKFLFGEGSEKPEGYVAKE
jgi:Fe-S cluster biosynthesis and repair protein YggX